MPCKCQMYRICQFGVDQFHNWKSGRNIKFYCCFLTTSVNRSTPLASEINRMHFMKIQLDCFNCFKLFPHDRGEVMDGFGITFRLKLDRCKKNKMCIILTELSQRCFSRAIEWNETTFLIQLISKCQYLSLGSIRYPRFGQKSVINDCWLALSKHFSSICVLSAQCNPTPRAPAVSAAGDTRLQLQSRWCVYPRLAPQLYSDSLLLLVRICVVTLRHGDTRHTVPTLRLTTSRLRPRQTVVSDLDLNKHLILWCNVIHSFYILHALMRFCHATYPAKGDPNSRKIGCNNKQ